VGLLDLLVLLDNQVCQDQVDHLDLLARKVVWVKLVDLVLLEEMGYKDLLDCLDHLAMLELEEKMVIRVNVDLLVLVA